MVDPCVLHLVDDCALESDFEHSNSEGSTTWVLSPFCIDFIECYISRVLSSHFLYGHIYFWIVSLSLDCLHSKHFVVNVIWFWVHIPVNISFLHFLMNTSFCGIVLNFEGSTQNPKSRMAISALSIPYSLILKMSIMIYVPLILNLHTMIHTRVAAPQGQVGTDKESSSSPYILYQLYIYCCHY